MCYAMRCKATASFQSNLENVFLFVFYFLSFVNENHEERIGVEAEINWGGKCLSPHNNDRIKQKTMN